MALKNKLFFILDTFKNKPILAQHITVYRFVVALSFIITITLALAIPVFFAEPDDWTYYFGVQNFAHGQFTVNSQIHSQQVSEAVRQGGQPIQYWNIGNNKWASFWQVQ